MFRDKVNQFSELQVGDKQYITIHYYSIFFMIILINLRTKKSFLELCFEKDSKVTRDIIRLISISKYYHSNRVPNVFCNIFLDEYRDIFFSNNIEDLFIFNNEKFTKINIEGLDKYPKEVYQKVLKLILDLEYTYEDNLIVEVDRQLGIFFIIFS
jgi:hypothetical protein